MKLVRRTCDGACFPLMPCDSRSEQLRGNFRYGVIVRAIMEPRRAEVWRMRSLPEGCEQSGGITDSDAERILRPEQRTANLREKATARGWRNGAGVGE